MTNLKTLFVCATAGATLTLGLIQSSAKGQVRSKGNQDTREEVEIGLRIAPVALNLNGRDRTLVGLGSYYVNGISDCVGCHDGATGHLGGGVPFGPVQSRNLTPDKNGRPAGLTFSEFTAVIRQGIDFKQLPPDTGDPDLLIVMPWQSYRHGTDTFLEALYAYLQSVPCLEGGPGQLPNRCN
jgi:hypothetical protein